MVYTLSRIQGDRGAGMGKKPTETKLSKSKENC